MPDTTTPETGTPVTAARLVEAAKAEIEAVTPREAARMMQEEGALLLDVRDAPELQAGGTAIGAHHVPRGMLEFRADPESPLHDKEFRRDRPVITFCAAGPRGALAAKTLKDMGYARVVTIGGFKDWAAAELPVTQPLDPGM
jgi:rhodanese-related sulfurtransferase